MMRSEEITPPCNCTRYDCEVEGRCLEKGLIYQCKVKQTETGTVESYIGLTETTFMERLTTHRSSINNEGYHRNSFSSHVWDLKRRRVNFELKWRIIAKGKPYSPSTKLCDLCIKEIYYIMFEKNMATLNKGNEFFGSFPHRFKYLLQNQ